MVFACGEDIQMVYYRQREAAGKSCLQLEESILSFISHGRKWLYHSLGKVEINPGEGFFMSRGNYLRTERMGDRFHGYTSLVIRLSDRFLASLDGLCPPDAAPGVQERPEPVVRLRQDSLLTELVAQLSGYFESPGEKARVEAVLPLKIRELLTLLVTSPANRDLGVLLRQQRLLQENSFTVLMEAQFREVMSLGQLAFLAGLSLSSFKRKFEATYQMPPRRWIQQRRLKEAYVLLGDRRRNVTEVCFEVGFENLPHFVQLFKQRYHITPKQRQSQDPEPQMTIFEPPAKAHPLPPC